MRYNRHYRYWCDTCRDVVEPKYVARDLVNWSKYVHIVRFWDSDGYDDWQDAEFCGPLRAITKEEAWQRME